MHAEGVQENLARLQRANTYPLDPVVFASLRPPATFSLTLRVVVPDAARQNPKFCVICNTNDVLLVFVDKVFLKQLPRPVGGTKCL